MFDTILANLAMVINSSCVYLINSYIYHKPPGAQTLYDLVLAHTLTILVALIWTVVISLDLAEVSGPVPKVLAWSFCAVIDFLTFLLHFFLILTVSVRYFSIYHSTLLSNVEDHQFMKKAWRLILLASFILTVSENNGVTPFETMTLYNLLMENFEADQVGSKLNGFLFLTMTILFIALQYKIEMDDANDNMERSNDRWTCFNVVALFFVLCLVLFGFNPTVKTMAWRMVLQITWTTGFLIRFMMQNQNLFEYVKLKFLHQPLIVVHY